MPDETTDSVGETRANVEKQSLVLITKTDVSAELVNPTAKNGVITAIGFILAFSLNFISGWVFQWPVPSGGKGGWSWIDFLPAVPIFVGVACLIKALYGMLLPYNLPVSELPKRVNFVVGGIILVFVGVLLAIVTNQPQIIRFR